MKRGLLAFALGCLLVMPAYGFDLSQLSPVVGDIEVHPDVLGGTVPASLTAGGRYTGLTLIPGHMTSVTLRAGGGYMSRNIWKGTDGKEETPPYEGDAVSLWNARWEVIFSQGLLSSSWTGRDFFSLYAGYSGRWEHMTDTEGTVYESPDLAVFPDGDGIISHALIGGAALDGVRYDGIVPAGAVLRAEYWYAPGWLGNRGTGETDFSMITASIKGYYPLYASRTQQGRNLVSVYLANRIRADRVFGFESGVPMYAQNEFALGSHMRGLERLSRAGSLTAVNNFDVRFVGPEVFADRLYPRFHLFFDCGYTDGRDANTNSGEEQWFAAAGAEGGISFFDFLNAGYRASFMTAGENMADESFVHGVYMSLQFD